MKVTKQQYAQLTELLDGIKAHIDGGIKHWEKIYTDQGLSLMRFRWDCFYTIPQKQRFKLVDDLYKECNDTHIDTALRKYFGHKK